MNAVATIKRRFSTIAWPTFKRPTITMPWTKQHNALLKRIDELEALVNDLGNASEFLSNRIDEVEAGVEEAVDERFEGTQFVERMEVEGMIESEVEEGLENNLEDIVRDQITRALDNATFEVSVNA
jgi:hypothetical protein